MTLLILAGIAVLAVLLISVPLSLARRRRGPELEPPPTTPERLTKPSQGPGARPGRSGRPARPSRGRPPGRRPGGPVPPTATAPPGPPAPPGSPATGLPAPPATAVPAPAEVPVEVPAPVEVPPELEAEIEAALAPPVRPRFRDRLGRARALFSGFLSRTAIDEEAWEDLEEALIRADVGVSLTTTLLAELRLQVRAEGIKTSDELVEALKTSLKKTLASADRGLRLDPGETNVWLFVGVNGVGKTTTIGKLGYREAAAGRSVVMAAGDTFRAAAAEQLALWATRVGADLVRGAEGGDPSAVIYDAVQRAASRGAELVLADTAGRLHTKLNLMEELKKVRRVAERPPGHLTEVLLVIDATTGQNGLIQARQFTDAVDITGIVLTKLDGTAKGGIALAIQSGLGIPIKLVGLGETADDLTEFDPDEFVEALLSP